MNDRTFRSSKWLVGAAGRITLLTLVITGLTGCAQPASENALTNPPSVEPPGAAVTVAPAVIAPVATPPALPAAPASSAPAASAVEAPGAVAPAIPEDLSPGLAEIVRLVQARVGDDVVIAYINNSAMVYRPTADEILYLNDLGVSDAVLTALLGHTNLSATEPASQPSAASSQAAVTGAPAPTYSVGSTFQTAPSAPAATPILAPAPEPPTVVAAPPPAVVAAPLPADVVYFQDSLAPYGTWVYADGYGWAWQPTVVVANPTWAPYCDRGRWIYTDCGWYWESDYSWGWAPFHYGRWWRHDHYGWVWCPDRVWGPAWVCWRNHDAYCGWAPLPPGAEFRAGVGLTFHHGHVGVDFDFGLSAGCFTFVAYDHFRDPHPDHFRVPHHEVPNVYRHSKVVNNYTIVNNTTIINEGVGREHIAKMTHQPVHPVSIHPVESRPGPGRVERLENGGGTLSVYRPPAAAPRASSPGVAAAGHPPVTINHFSQPSQPSQGRPGRGNDDGASRVTTARPDRPTTGGQSGNRDAGRPTPPTSGNRNDSRPPAGAAQSGARNEVRPTPPMGAARPGIHSESLPTAPAGRDLNNSGQVGAVPPKTPAPSQTPTASRTATPAQSGATFNRMDAGPAPSRSTYTAPTRTEVPMTSSSRPASRGPMVSQPATLGPAPSVGPAPTVRSAPSRPIQPGGSDSVIRPDRFGNGNRKAD